MVGLGAYLTVDWISINYKRPEDLSFLNTDKFAVAFLAQTLILKNQEVHLQAWRQALKELQLATNVRIKEA